MENMCIYNQSRTMNYRLYFVTLRYRREKSRSYGLIKDDYAYVLLNKTIKGYHITSCAVEKDVYKTETILFLSYQKHNILI